MLVREHENGTDMLDVDAIKRDLKEEFPGIQMVGFNPLGVLVLLGYDIDEDKVNEIMERHTYHLPKNRMAA